MAYTFGGASGDDITWGEVATTWGASGQAGLIAGWYYPTALTTGLALWSSGTVNRAVIASTTTEIDIFLDRTTDAQRTTSGLGLAVDTWQFIAILGAFNNTGAVTNYVVWRGFGTEVPSKVTVNTTVAGTGNVNVNATITIGNIGTAGTSSFQGDISRFDFVYGTAQTALLTVSDGTIPASDEVLIFNELVIPIWRGEYPGFYKSGGARNSNVSHIAWDLDMVSLLGQRFRVIPAAGLPPYELLPATGAVWTPNSRPIHRMNPAMFTRTRR